ncbi:MAG: hypothetical protein ACK2UO_14665 [Caldilineaceae bacterium]
MYFFGVGILVGLAVGLAIEWAVDWSALFARTGSKTRGEPADRQDE